MRIIDSKLKGHIRQYVFQTLIATISLFVVLVYVDIFLETAVVASIGATSFIIFTLPKRRVSSAFLILGGYGVGTIVGLVGNYVLIHVSGISPNVIGALVVGLTMFLMVITNTEHPPAAALALGIAIEGYTSQMLFVVYSVTLVLLIIKKVFKHWFIDLI